MSKHRPLTWRWLVVLHDLSPLPPYREVVTGHLTKRAAEGAARLIRRSHDWHSDSVWIGVAPAKKVRW